MEEQAKLLEQLEQERAARLLAEAQLREQREAYRVLAEQYRELQALHEEPVVSLEGFRVLLAEDNHLNKVMAVNLLQQWKCSVATAVNGQEAVDALREQVFDLVLMDLQMPEMDGLQAARIIRSDLQLSIPIIALTADPTDADRTNASLAGMNSMLSKPIQPAVMQELLQHYAANAPQPTSALPAGSLVDLGQLKASTSGDPAFMQRMLSLTISETDKKIILLTELLEKKAFRDIQGVAHSMKPSIDHVAIPAVRQLVRDVEHPAEEGDAFAALVQHFIETMARLVDELRLQA